MKDERTEPVEIRVTPHTKELIRECEKETGMSINDVIELIYSEIT